MSVHSHQEHLPHGEGGFFSREAVSGIPWMVLAKLVLFFVYFGVSVLTVNGLGKEKFGIYSLMVNISAYLLVFCGLGLGSALMRYVPELASHRNWRGLFHLLWKSAALQVMATCVVSGLIFSMASPLQRLFGAEDVVHFKHYLMLACGLVGLLLLKDFVVTVFTSLFRTRTVALLSVVQGLVWLLLLFVWLASSPEITTVFYVQMFSIGVVYMLGAMLLSRHVHGLDWRKNLTYGIGKRRTLKFSATAMLSAIFRMVMFKYSEIFFLAFAAGTTVAGMYDLGYTLPFTVVTFIPLALLSLFTAAFAEAYVKDKNCLGRLISSYYKILIMVSLPVAVPGAFFSPVAYHIIYKGEMDGAGRIASVFCIVLLLPLISIPLSTALKAKEKAHNMLPMMLLQIAVNLTLDWLLIVHLRWGVWGGVGAVAGTFSITIAPRLLVTRDILGGIYFPGKFFLRIVLALVMEAAAFFWLTRQIRLFELFSNEWINIGLLFAVGIAYLLVFLLLVRILRLVRQVDIAD
ncbi:MAG: oligosaccharide flippase family protein, partial [Verrucomicrobiota bacterium]